MRIDARGALGVVLFASAAGACHSQELVVPFIDAGAPCAPSPTPRPIDCAQFADTTCVAEGTSCPRETYGCADAAYFTKEDYSQCPPEAGSDGSPLSDASLLGDGSVLGGDAADGSASDAGDASD